MSGAGLLTRVSRACGRVNDGIGADHGPEHLEVALPGGRRERHGEPAVLGTAPASRAPSSGRRAGQNVAKTAACEAMMVLSSARSALRQQPGEDLSPPMPTERWMLAIGTS